MSWAHQSRGGGEGFSTGAERIACCVGPCKCAVTVWYLCDDVVKWCLNFSGIRDEPMVEVHRENAVAPS